MIIAKHIKQPAEVKYYAVNCGGWLNGRSLDTTDGLYPQAHYDRAEFPDFVVDFIQVESVDGVPSLMRYKVSGGLDGDKIVVNFRFKTNTNEIIEDEIVFIIKEIG